MNYILIDNKNISAYSFLSKGLDFEFKFETSPTDGSMKVLGWLWGVVKVLMVSKKNDAIICWFDFQAIICYWISLFLFMKREIVCINIMLKDKETIKNRFVTFLYKKALQASNFKASVTSVAYAEALNKRLGISVKYDLIRDVYRDFYDVKYEGEIEKRTIFCGGRNGRDWRFIIQLAREMRDFSFVFVVSCQDYLSMKDLSSNVKVLVDVSYKEFMSEMCKAEVVCLPLNTDAPAGLIVLFQAAANEKNIITTKTLVTQEYVMEECGCLLPNDLDLWKKAIQYYCDNPEESQRKSKNLKRFLQNNCSESKFIFFVNKLVK